MASFINDAFDKALNDYIKFKKMPECVSFSSFLVVVIRELVTIYDEVDILTPYSFKDDGAIKNNIAKYGYNFDSIDDFFNKIEEYSKNETDDGFECIQKAIIDMFIKKHRSENLSEDKINEFRDIIYSPYSSNPLIVSYNFLMSKDPMMLINYLNKELNSEEKREIVKSKNLLNIEAYEILKYSMKDIKSMDADKVDSINKKVYEFFNISEDAINKSYLLDKAIYDYKNPKASLSSGNGFVDLLFILSIVATVGMIVLIVTLVAL